VISQHWSFELAEREESETKTETLSKKKSRSRPNRNEESDNAEPSQIGSVDVNRI
jgi:hypothetical protein